jgi:CDP-diacylglycerol--glycerol-3-phosphate 3-phosphatidyltransferase
MKMSRVKREEVLNLANAVTSLRLIGAIILIFIEPLSAAFYVVYTICGLSDGIDGTIARKMGTSSEFGARLDSVSDIAFYLVMFIKLMPVLWTVMPEWIWHLVGVVLAVRLCAYGMAYLKYHMMAAIHTYMNKVTGALVFLIPYMLLLPCDVTLCAITACFALAGSAEEFLIHAVSPVYQAERKSIFAKPVK